MIESKQQVLDNFRGKARAFLADPNAINGIDLDDAAVTLKRFVLTETKDTQLGSALADFQKLIRQLDVDAVSAVVAEVERRLSE